MFDAARSGAFAAAASSGAAAPAARIQYGDCLSRRTFTPPWRIDDNINRELLLRDRSGRALAYAYYKDESGRRMAAPRQGAPDRPPSKSGD
jgi:hypothetical protein